MQPSLGYGTGRVCHDLDTRDCGQKPELAKALWDAAIQLPQHPAELGNNPGMPALKTGLLGAGGDFCSMEPPSPPPRSSRW